MYTSKYSTLNAVKIFWNQLLTDRDAAGWWPPGGADGPLRRVPERAWSRAGSPRKMIVAGHEPLELLGQPSVTYYRAPLVWHEHGMGAGRI